MVNRLCTQRSRRLFSIGFDVTVRQLRHEQIAKLQAEKEELMKLLRTKLLLEQVSKTMTYEELVEKLGAKLDD